MATISVDVQDQDEIHPTSQPTFTGTTIFRSKLPDIDINNSQPLHTYCFEKLHLLSNKPCIIDGSSGKIYTYGEIHLLCRKSAAGLAALGVGQGDVVMVLLQNCPEFAITLMACSMLGAVMTMANPFCTSHEIYKQFEASGAKLVVTQSSYVGKLRSEEFPAIGDGMTVVTVDDNCSGDELPDGCHGLSALSDANEDDVPTVVIEPNDPVALPFSSGTTGLPKGVILTHKSIITSVAQQVDGENPNLYITPEDVFLCVLPLFHIFSLSSVLLCSLRAGCGVVLMKKFEMGLLLELIQKHRVSLAAVVPPLVLALAKNPTVENYDLTSIRIVLSGGAPLGNELEDSLRQRLPHAVLGQGYGMTEAGPVISMCPAFAKEASPCKSGSCGSIVRNAEMKIIDPDTGVSLPHNQPGEVCIRGEEIMKGYLNDPEATSKTIDVDGWIHTGDIGYVDDDEEIFIVDRVKELIKFKGFQVPPAEIEALLLTNPGIADAAVVPQKDDTVGEVPVAFVVRSTTDEGINMTEEMVKDFVARLQLHLLLSLSCEPSFWSMMITNREEERRSDGSDSEEEDEMEKQLAEVPLGELQKARADGSLSSYRNRVGEKVFGRANKNRPTEISSKVPVQRFKEVIQVPKKVFRDPRFETLCGTLDQDGFRNRYNFLFDVNLPAEKKKLQMMIKKSTDPKAREDLQKNIIWIDKKIKSAPTFSKNADARILSEHKKNEREAAKKGKMPFYLKKGEIRERKLVQKYNELKSSGKLESFMDKRRKKNASKDHRYMPYRRPGNS